MTLTESLVSIEILKQESVITSGSTVQDLVDLAQKSIMIVVRSMAAEVLTVRWAVSAIVSWKYGTMYLPSSTVMDMVDMKN